MNNNHKINVIKALVVDGVVKKNQFFRTNNSSIYGSIQTINENFNEKDKAILGDIITIKLLNFTDYNEENSNNLKYFDIIYTSDNSIEINTSLQTTEILTEITVKNKNLKLLSVINIVGKGCVFSAQVTKISNIRKNDAIIEDNLNKPNLSVDIGFTAEVQLTAVHKNNDLKFENLKSFSNSNFFTIKGPHYKCHGVGKFL